MDENKEMNFVKDVEVSLKKIECESNPNNNQEVKRLRFIFDKFDVTWKPKIQKTRKVAGIEVTDIVPADLDNLPEKLKDISTALNEEGILKMKIKYTKLDTKNAEGEPVTYRFITSEKTLNDWERLSTKEETVKEE